MVLFRRLCAFVFVMFFVVSVGAQTPKLLTISIASNCPQAPIAQGASITLVATGHFSSGPDVPITNGIVWRTTNDAVKVDPDSGVVTAAQPTAPDFAKIEATLPGNQSVIFGECQITVSQPVVPNVTLQGLSIAPSGILYEGSTINMVATGLYGPAGQAASTAKLVTNKITWMSSDETIAKFADASKGTLSGVKAGGPVTITATSSDATQAAAVVPQTISVMVIPPAPLTVRIDSKLVAGRSFIPIRANQNHVISFYQFDGYRPAEDCEKDVNARVPLSVVTTAPNTSNVSLPIPTGQYTLTLAFPLQPETSVCFSDAIDANDAHPMWSVAVPVTDPDDYDRVRTYFVAGVQISNQQASTASSTAGTYLEAGFNFTWLRAKDSSDFRYRAEKPQPGGAPTVTKPLSSTPEKFEAVYKTGGTKRTPGISTNLDIRLSPIPVAATATTMMTAATAPTATTTMATTVVTPNLLTSQQSARVVGSLYFPFKVTHWNKHTNFFTLAPLVRGGFATLLNPSVGSTQATTTNSASMTTTNTTSANFSSTYSFFAFGTRLGWDRYPASSDKAPQTVTQFLVTLGNYSNLPSFVCSGPAGHAATFTNTACGVSGTSTAMLPVDSRTLVPRLDIDGFAKLPNYPFVLGIDANLAQYTIAGRQNIDYLNKAGNDIRVYVGLRIDLNSLINKLGVTLP